jgi:hypothetical protein
MSFKCRIVKQIHGCFAACSTEDKGVQKNIELPFAPFPGLVIYGPDDFNAVIEHVSYDLEKNTFRLITEPNKEIYEAQLHRYDHRPVKEIVDEYLECGWEKED